MPYSSYDKPFVARRDFDFIPRRSEVIVAPAENRDFEPLAAMANAKVPDVCATGELLREAAARDRDSILSFRLKGVLLGGVAFVFLNQIGVEGLLLDSIDLARPTAAIMANPIDDVAGIYIWATALDGRGILGLGNVAEHLSKRRFRFADLYGRPNTEDGRRLVQSVGFKPAASFQQNLWIYRRAWKRVPHTSAGNFQTDYAHA
jgi:hypothetical protein